VLFLPGIEGSRLYKPRSLIGEDRLWEPNIDADVNDLSLNTFGVSIYSDIYTRDILDQYFDPGSNTDLYKTFTSFMDSQVTTGTIVAWKAVPYDWRLAPKDLVNGGVVHGSNISYTDTATSSYMVDQVLQLASSSRTGKVTIIAHSNGGLIAKELVSKLVSLGHGDVVDKLVFVATPQLGTPKAIPALLHGYGQSLFYGLVTSQKTARSLAQNLPGAYYLLPSTQYENLVQTPPVLFDKYSSSTKSFISLYGTYIRNKTDLDEFIRFSNGTTNPDDINTPILGNALLLNQANDEHNSVLDVWTPPASTTVYQLIGEGMKTLIATRYLDDCSGHCTGKTPHLSIEPVNVFDGDGTVLAVSANAGAGEKWYFDARAYNAQFNSSKVQVEHSTLMGANPVLSFLSNIITGATTTIPFVSQTPPDFSTLPHTVLRAHSPVSLDVYDAQSRHTGLATTTLVDGTVRTYIENGIPGVTYDVFGEVKYIYNDSNVPLHVVMRGTGTGYLTYDMQQLIGATTVASTTFIDIPVSTSTFITEDTQPDIPASTPLLIDQNGDGVTDVTLPAQGTQYYDSTPPEALVTFSTSTRSIILQGTDSNGTTTTTTNPRYVSQCIEYRHSVCTRTSTIKIGDITTFTDAAQNSLSVYTTVPRQDDHLTTLSLTSLTYQNQSNSTTTTATTTLFYDYRTNRAGTITQFSARINLAASTAYVVYDTRTNRTLVTTVTAPQRTKDDDDDEYLDRFTEGEAKKRNTNTTALPGLHIPSITTLRGIIRIDY
jgi:pimeloyl-ACP methyl ester carboxylesterase